MSVDFPTPEDTLNAFFADALAFERAITKTLGVRWKPLFRAIRSRAGRLRFSDEQSDAAFVIDPVTNEFVFFKAGFDALRLAIVELFGSELQSSQAAYLIEIADVSYGLHEIFHPEQGFSEFSIVQDHKQVPSGYDEIGKIDHISDNVGMSLIAAVHLARTERLDRVAYLQKFRDISYLVNRAAPIAFGAPAAALHKQKRRLINWLVFQRADDALRENFVTEVEHAIGPLDAPLWMHFNSITGDMVLWEQQPMHRVLGTARVRPTTLRMALDFEGQMNHGQLGAPLRALLRALRVDAASVRTKLQDRISPTQAS